MSEANIILAVMLSYLGLMLAIGIWARRNAHTSEGYFLAGRNLPYWVVAFSMNATGESAWLDAPELYIGGSAAGAGGTGNLVEVENGGTVYTESLNIYSNNAFDLNDGGRLFVNTNFNASMDNFNWNTGGTLEVGGELSGMTNSR